jgi:uncharacterized protein with HEPN domain
MAPEDKDAAYLWDMLTAAKDAVEILGELTVDDFKADKLHCRAIERSVEIIGEAAHRRLNALPSRALGNSMAGHNWAKKHPGT